jgi:hypothetical protein
VGNPGAHGGEDAGPTIAAGRWIRDSSPEHGFLRCNCPEMRRIGTAVSLR